MVAGPGQQGHANATLGLAAPLPLRSSRPVDWGDSLRERASASRPS